ncbi:protein CURVATURE THYLAKOID 1B, chloroplastic [Beta vulgaris subsp. vulgaris]|uniref:protein CURVATURE THYLAKOID 1B, chloroplastic n=1 Tax=Beta vulgaris subsp. vulgaris TaxID=3555 RepID=UPI002036B348|nr:protein CURVATURE THYLAKOID 1B, chloroplastic [Beta vulgaris subsp. vulgaris]
MATTATNALSLSSSSTLVDAKAALRQPASASPQCVTLPTLPPPPVQSQGRVSRTTTYCRKIARNVVAMATGEAQVAAAPAVAPATTPESTDETSSAVDSLDTSEIVKTIQEAWDKVEDKYAVSTLAAAGAVALWGSTGMISAIDRLPLIPGVLELVGIGYTGWFAYRNLVFKPEREALIKKIKDTYKDIIGSS